MTTYTLTPAETTLYDSRDDRDIHTLRRALIDRFGGVDGAGLVEVYHPDGFVVDRYEGVTDAQIADLRAEAAAAGDDAQVALCDDATAGDRKARLACLRVRLDALAMQD